MADGSVFKPGSALAGGTNIAATPASETATSLQQRHEADLAGRYNAALAQVTTGHEEIRRCRLAEARRLGPWGLAGLVGMGLLILRDRR